MADFRGRLVKTFQKRLAHAFKIGWGVSICSLYKIKSTKNFYGDEMEQVAQNYQIVPVMVEYNSPRRVVQSLNWYKEGDALPIIAYFPAIAEGLSKTLIFNDGFLTLSTKDNKPLKVKIYAAKNIQRRLYYRPGYLSFNLYSEGVLRNSVAEVVSDLMSFPELQSVLNIYGSGNSEVVPQKLTIEETPMILLDFGDIFYVGVDRDDQFYQKGWYRILEVSEMGHGDPIGWVVRCEPLRDTPPGGVDLTAISVTGIRPLVFVGGKATTELSLSAGEELCINWQILPSYATDKHVTFEIEGNLVFENKQLSLKNNDLVDAFGNLVGGTLTIVSDSGHSLTYVVNGYEV